MQMILWTGSEELERVRNEAEAQNQNGYVQAWVQYHKSQYDVQIIVDAVDAIKTPEEGKGVYMVRVYKRKQKEETKMTEQYNKKADEIAALYGLSLTGKGFEMADEAEWQQVREQVMVSVKNDLTGGDNIVGYFHPSRYANYGTAEWDLIGAVYLIPRHVIEAGARYAPHQTGEDAPFCEAARRLGYRLLVDMGVRCEHRMVKV